MKVAVALLSVWVTLIAAEPAALRFERGFLEAPPPLHAHHVRFTARIGGMHIYCRSTGISIATARKLDSITLLHRIDLDFAQQPHAVVPAGERSEVYRVVRSIHEQYRLRAFEQVRYVEVAPGVDVVLRWSPQQLKYDVVVRPGGDISRLRFVVRGAQLKRTATGALELVSTRERFLDLPPTAVQTSPNGALHAVAVHYEVSSDSTFGYRVEEGYNAALPLTIDPAIVWSTYVGGSQDDAANDVAVDASGTTYICGNSASLDFPRRGTTVNRGRQNMVIAAFSPGGQHLWSTYFGGESEEIAKAIVCDSQRRLLYVGGWSSSPSVLLSQPYPNRAGGAFDAVVLAFGMDGTFVRGTFLGGSREELVNALALRKDGILIATGRTNSPDFPIAQALQPSNAGDNDVFITALAVPAFDVVWSTYYGGSGFEEAYGVTISDAGSIFLTGVTVSTDFPTANAFQPRPSQRDNAFVVALSSSGRRLWATYLGGDDYDLGNRIAAANGKLYITGTTSSTDFPTAGDSIAQREKHPFNDAFLTCMSETGTLLWSTFWGGSGPESGFSVVVLPNGDVCVAGSTSSPDFPRRRSILWSARGGDDVFVALFRNGANVWSATLGGSSDDILYAAALMPSGDIIGVGETRSRDFEPLVNAQYSFNPAASNTRDCFLFRLCTFAPQVLTTAERLVLCPGSSIELFASDSARIASLQWNTGSTATRIRVTAAGSYWFVATSIDGCTVSSDTLTVRAASSAPVAVDTIEPRRSLVLCEGERAALIVRGRYRSVAWIDTTGSIVTVGDTLWASTSGIYRAVVVDTNGCTLQSQPQRIKQAQRPPLRYVRHFPDGSKVELTSDTISACSGEFIELEIARPLSTQCVWSDGSTECRRIIRTALQLRASVIDSIGCQWQLNAVTLRFEPRAQLTVVAPDTVCQQVPFELRISAPRGQARWELPPPLAIDSASADSTLLRLVAARSGSFTIRTWLIDRCSDTASRTISIVAAPQVRITAERTALCPGDSAVLRAPAGFTTYVWNGTAGAAELIARDTGWYYLEARTSYGCSARDSVYIASIPLLQSSAQRLQFGAVQVGQTVQQQLLLSNPAQSDAEFTLAIVRGTDFAIAAPQPPQGALAPQSQQTIALSFSPRAVGIAVDTLLVVQSSPCSDTLRVALEGTGTPRSAPPELFLAIDDHTISPHDSTIDIPIYVWTTPPPPRIDTARVEVSYNPTMLLPLTVTRGRIAYRSYQPPDRALLQLEIPLDSLAATPRTQQLTTLHAAVLLGDREEDSVQITSVDVSPPQPIVVHSTGGILRYTELCRAGGTRLLGYRALPTLMIAPNPSDGAAVIAVVSPESGSIVLSIYTLDGRLAYATQWNARAGQLSSFAVPHLSAGAYVVQLRTVSGDVVTALMSIVR